MDDYLGIEAILSESTFMIWREWREGRRISTAELVSPISLPSFGSTPIVVVTEPKWYEEGPNRNHGLSYAAFYQPDLAGLRKSVRLSKLCQHAVIGETTLALFSSLGQEVRFTGVRHTDLVVESIKSDRFRLVAGYPHAIRGS
jgi:hypothetical protein